MNRELDGVFFRVKRDGKFDNVCFSDLEEFEADEILTSCDDKWILSLIKILSQTLNDLLNTCGFADADRIMLTGHDRHWLIQMCKLMGAVIRNVGDGLGIVGGCGGDED